MKVARVEGLLKTIVEQNDKIIENLILRRRPLGDTSETSVLLDFRPLVSVNEILRDEKWCKAKYRENVEKHALELACDLASKCIFGDDILKSNVLKADKYKPALNVQKLQEIKCLVQNVCEKMCVLNKRGLK